MSYKHLIKGAAEQIRAGNEQAGLKLLREAIQVRPDLSTLSIRTQLRMALWEAGNIDADARRLANAAIESLSRSK
jgi:hypothetical protein